MTVTRPTVNEAFEVAAELAPSGQFVRRSAAEHPRQVCAADSPTSPRASFDGRRDVKCAYFDHWMIASSQSWIAQPSKIVPLILAAQFSGPPHEQSAPEDQCDYGDYGNEIEHFRRSIASIRRNSKHALDPVHRQIPWLLVTNKAQTLTAVVFALLEA
jgi:hypothetical protein